MIEVQPGTMVLFADIGCPWAHAAVHRWRGERVARGLEDVVHLDVRAFPLEIFNRRPTPKLTLDVEIPVAGALAPDAGWQPWQGAAHAYPVTMLPALEAVHAAKAQSLAAGEDLDHALRGAFFARSRCVSMRHEILEIAQSCRRVDTSVLERDLDTGRFRRAVLDDLEVASSDLVKGSPHFFLPDGSDHHNPGVEMHWEGEHGKGFPVVDKDDPGVYAEMFDRLGT